jgi:hypothetical protein
LFNLLNVFDLPNSQINRRQKHLYCNVLDTLELPNFPVVTAQSLSRHLKMTILIGPKARRDRN